MVDYIGVADIQRLLTEIGTGTFIERLAQEIETDYNPAPHRPGELRSPHSRVWLSM